MLCGTCPYIFGTETQFSISILTLNDIFFSLFSHKTLCTDPLAHTNTIATNRAQHYITSYEGTFQGTIKFSSSSFFFILINPMTNIHHFFFSDSIFFVELLNFNTKLLINQKIMPFLSRTAARANFNAAVENNKMVCA